MPKVSGHDVCRRTRAQDWGRDVYLIALTGWGQETDRLLTKEVGFDHHLVKPVDGEAIVEALSRAPASQAMT